MCVSLTLWTDTHAYNHMFLKIVNLPAGGAGLSPHLHYWYGTAYWSTLWPVSLSRAVTLGLAQGTPKITMTKQRKDSYLTQKSSLTYSSKITNTTSRHFIKIKM